MNRAAIRHIVSSSQLLWPLIAFGMIGCSMGTEVGNGVKPRKEEPRTNGSVGSASPDQSQEGTDTSGQVKTDQPASDGFSNSDFIASRVNYLFANCASPFSAQTAGTFVASATGATVDETYTLDVAGDADGNRIVRSSRDISWLVSIKSGTHAVTVTTLDARAVGTGYQCGAVTERTGVSHGGLANLKAYTVTVTDNVGGKAVVSWYVSPTKVGDDDNRVSAIDVELTAAPGKVLSLAPEQ